MSLFVCLYTCFFDCRCKRLNRLGENKHNNKNIKASRKTLKTKQTEIQDIQPRTRPRINVIDLFAEVRGLDILYLCFFCVFMFFVLEDCIYIYIYICIYFNTKCVVCFRLVYFSFCIYNRTKTYTNRNNRKILRRKQTNKHTHKNIYTLFPSRNLRDIYSRSGPGLDILYLCFSRSFSVFVFVCCSVFA